MSGDRIGYRALRRQRTFLALIGADAVDGTASWAYSTVLSAVVYQATGSFVWITAALAARWIPALLLGPFAGLLGDRFGYGRVMAASATASAVAMLGVALAIAASAPVTVIVIVSALQAVVATPYAPAFAASLPDVLPERLLLAANGAREVVTNTTVVVGPVLGAAFLLLDAPAWAVGLNAASFLVPVAMVVATGLVRRAPASDTAVEDAGGPVAAAFRELREGVQALRVRRSAFVLVVAASIDTALMGLATVMAIPIAIRVGSGADHYAYLLVASAIGAVLAAGVAGRLAARSTLAGVTVGSLVVQGLPFAALLIWTTPAVAFAVNVVSGAAMVVVDILAVTALQRDLPRQYLGRVFGIFETILLTLLVVTTTAGGVVVEAVGLTPVLVVMGVVFPVLTLAGLPLLRAVDARTAEHARTIAPVVDLLAELDLFDGADRPVLERLAMGAESHTFGAGHRLLTEGEPSDHLWILHSGELAITSSTAEGLPDVAAPGYVGEIGLLHQRPRTATVTVSAPSALFRIPGEEFVDAVSGATVSAALTQVVGVRLARTSGDLGS